MCVCVLVVEMHSGFIASQVHHLITMYKTYLCFGDRTMKYEQMDHSENVVLIFDLKVTLKGFFFFFQLLVQLWRNI